MLKIGSDPECFLRDKNGNVVSAIGLLPGSKHNPYKTKNGSVQVDNILAEFNSIPADNLFEFIQNHKLVLNDLTSIITPLDLHLDFMASHLADDQLLSDPESMIAGCDPDFCAWTLTANPPANYYLTNVRAAGGHLHCSFDQADNDPHHTNRINFVKGLDLVLGVPSVLYDNDTQRRKYYGRAGSFRPKDIEQDPYNGVEYRTLSNFWLKSEELMAFVYRGVELVYKDLVSWAEMAVHHKNEIIEIINSGNQDKAYEFCNRLGVPYGLPAL